MCYKSKIVLLFLAFFTMQNLEATRNPAVAGSFYSDKKIELSKQVNTLLQNAQSFKKESIAALIVPHAGYVFSAKTAAVAYKTLQKKYKNIFLIGSSHHITLNGASIYNKGNYKTPLGEVTTNKAIVSSLMKHPLFTYEKEAHTKEHTLEVQLPFLQSIYGDNLQIVPIIIGTQKLENIIEISKVLKPYFDDEESLFIISTDLSHYPTYEDANKIDKKTLNVLSKNSAEEFINILIENENSSSKALLTSACGWSSILILLNITQGENYKYELLEYINSGDTKYGDTERVVGYGALRVYKKSSEFSLTKEEKKELLDIARLSLYEATIYNRRVEIDESKVSAKLKRNLGAFVTLHVEKNLRGCIGRFEPNQPLYSVIIDMAIASAQNDPRFNKVTQNELENIDIEISVLTPRKQIHSLDEIVIGKHGIYIQKGSKNGTLLPHVATEMKWSKEEFINYCAQKKAGITQEEMKGADIFTYEAIVFEEEK